MLNTPTGFPLVCELDEDLNAIEHYYLGDEEKIRRNLAQLFFAEALRMECSLQSGIITRTVDMDNKG